LAETGIASLHLILELETSATTTAQRRRDWRYSISLLVRGTSRTAGVGGGPGGMGDKGRLGRLEDNRHVTGAPLVMTSVTNQDWAEAQL
jgi:hypothetical protein